MAVAMKACVLVSACGLLDAAQDDTRGVSIGLDVASWGGGPRLGISVSPHDEHGNVLPPQKLVLDTGSSTLAFCDASFADKLKSLQTQYYSCNTYGGDGSETTGYWGPFYQGAVQVHHSAVNVTMNGAYFSVMKQQFDLCESGFAGLFGIASRLLNEATIQQPERWPSSHAGSCPKFVTDLDDPVMTYLDAMGGDKQMGIYWSGKSGPDEGRLYLGEAARNNPHFDAGAAARIGAAKMSTQGNYQINVTGMDYDGHSFNVDCVSTMCSLDTGAPAIIVPRPVYDAAMKSRRGDLVVRLEGAENEPVRLVFDVETLINNDWLDTSTETIIGLPFRVFYYSLMDFTHSSLYFSPMPSHSWQSRNVSMIV